MKDWLEKSSESSDQGEKVLVLTVKSISES
jgi:hypothetical protein